MTSLRSNELSHAAGQRMQRGQRANNDSIPADRVDAALADASSPVLVNSKQNAASPESSGLPESSSSPHLSRSLTSVRVDRPDQRELLRIESIRKSFGQFKALDGVTFSLAAGERLAFLGPNGAGKTTLIRCLSGRCRPDSGTITVGGRPISDRGIRDWIGLVPQDIALYGDLTTRENLFAFGRFHGLRGGELTQRVDWALQWTGLVNRGNDLVGHFSGGMKRRVNLACGVLHRPKILLLDEPTVGVDPQSRHKIFEMLDDLSRQGTAIVLTTHHLDEAQSRSDRIVIMDHGAVVADGTIGDLVAQTVGVAKMVKVRLNQYLTQRIIVSNTTTVGEIGSDVVETRLNDVSTDLPRLLEAIRRCKREVLDIDVQAPALHHVFLHLTGHGLRDE